MPIIRPNAAQFHAEAVEGNEKWGSKSELLTKSGGQTPHVDRVLEKWGSSDPLDPVAPRSLISRTAHVKGPTCIVRC